MRTPPFDLRFEVQARLKCVLQGLGFGAFTLGLALLVGTAAAPTRTSLGIPVDDLSLRSGRELAGIYCGACHLMPEPDLLDRKTWEEQTLPRMLVRVGLAPEVIESNPESAYLKASGAFPESPLITKELWNRIAQFYLDTAPVEAIPQAPKLPIRVGLSTFERLPVKFRTPTPSTSLVRILSGTKEVVVGDDFTQSIYVLGGDGSLKHSMMLSNTVVSMASMPKGYLVAAIGNFQPAETPKGEVMFIGREGNEWKAARRLIHPLPRTTDAAVGDLDGDGLPDVVLCKYGNVAGSFSWYRNLGNDRYEERPLIERSGAIRVVAKDLDGDKDVDLAVLLAQETEALYMMMNDGKGNFSSRQIFQKHPLFGHTYFELSDINRDGLEDLVVTNGDNGEYASPLKNYHGVRIYLNRNKERFEEVYFYPLNGAFKAIARDFDGDGDVDLATIAFFPDYNQNPRESFVYLENQGQLRFVASTFRECISGRWLTMDAGDLDGDGDEDLVLGSYIRGPSPVPRFLMDQWQSNGPSIAILRNTSKRVVSGVAP